jgi:adenosylmethionine-8-amino-7-oxononanoate aminotransferase
VIREELVNTIYDSPQAIYMHGSTFGGHPVATAVAVANMAAMRDEGLFDHVLANEGMFNNKLQALANQHSCVKEVRGAGYFYAIELCADGENGQELSETQAAGLQGGVLGGLVKQERITIRPDDRGYTGLTISPPLIADQTVIDDLVERTDRVLTQTTTWLQANK